MRPTLWRESFSHRHQCHFWPKSRWAKILFMNEWLTLIAGVALVLLALHPAAQPRPPRRPRPFDHQPVDRDRERVNGELSFRRQSQPGGPQHVDRKR